MPNPMPSERNAPAGKIMISQGLNHSPNNCMPNNEPEPKISRTEPRTVSVAINPQPIATASRVDLLTGFLEAKASWRPRIIQFTTINGTYGPSALLMSGHDLIGHGHKGGDNNGKGGDSNLGRHKFANQRYNRAG